MVEKYLTSFSKTSGQNLKHGYKRNCPMQLPVKQDVRALSVAYNQNEKHIKEGGF
jgi:hypothetical protein